MKETLCVRTTVMAVSLLLMQAQFGILGQAQPAMNGQSAIVIIKVPMTREPVEITQLQVRGSDIAFGNPFVGDESWVNGLSLQVRNTSGNTISELRLGLSFETGGGNPRRVNIALIHRGTLQPNQTARVSAPTADIASLRRLLAQQGRTANFRRGELRVQFARFQDESLWVGGVVLGPRDPRTGRRRRI